MFQVNFQLLLFDIKENIYTSILLKEILFSISVTIYITLVILT
jgi:hypothetical protein